MPDDFPVSLISDVYRIEALHKAMNKMSNAYSYAGAEYFHIHPKYFMFSEQELFVCRRLCDFAQPGDDLLKKLRILAESMYNFKRYDVNPEKALAAGAQLIFHYELALERITNDDRVLDMACGTGWGLKMLAKEARHVIGIDLDLEALPINLAGFPANTTVMVADVTHTGFGDGMFDVITAFEILEHIDAEMCLEEAYRVLRPGGRLILSTPQNSLGKIPVNPWHIREYSLSELLELCAKFFIVDEVMGIKQGRIVIPGDPVGQNTFLVLHKKC
jgi:2-polyprenyl-3-methyl-5-hydroxy-6-metoxy-1,4-benzoquinol methylase